MLWTSPSAQHASLHAGCLQSSAPSPTSSAKRQRLDSQPREVSPPREAEKQQQLDFAGGVPTTAVSPGQPAGPGPDSSRYSKNQEKKRARQMLHAAQGHAKGGPAAASSAFPVSSQQQQPQQQQQPPQQAQQGSSASGDASAGSSFQPPAAVRGRQAAAPSQGGNPAGAALPAPQWLRNAVTAAGVGRAGFSRLKPEPGPGLGLGPVPGAPAGGNADGGADVIDLTQD